MSGTRADGAAGSDGSAGSGSDGALVCPCGSGSDYAECCGPLHAGEPAPSAERLMRSRFSAFALGLPDYLLASWDPETRPATLELDVDVIWRRLVVRDVSGGGAEDASGHVAFTAVARGPGGRIELRERSRFRRGASGRWGYLDGVED
ncbi:SEC-C domain-containing protein [Leucobacter allii]|uniref:SEC-C domain-containing protein n=1 Tax=Leucobacter allii TaxID=2932247 RepID=A0ABY4FIJ6_9MICO|nr:YchJ family metal-binding protein [Leucobacter allii]UOQ55833.1 SEC-C domain-containing protein [Leucobacter allii]